MASRARAREDQQLKQALRSAVTRDDAADDYSDSYIDSYIMDEERKQRALTGMDVDDDFVQSPGGTTCPVSLQLRDGTDTGPWYKVTPTEARRIERTSSAADNRKNLVDDNRKLMTTDGHQCVTHKGKVKSRRSEPTLKQVIQEFTLINDSLQSVADDMASTVRKEDAAAAWHRSNVGPDGVPYIEKFENNKLIKKYGYDAGFIPDSEKGCSTASFPSMGTPRKPAHADIQVDPEEYQTNKWRRPWPVQVDGKYARCAKDGTKGLEKRFKHTYHHTTAPGRGMPDTPIYDPLHPTVPKSRGELYKEEGLCVAAGLQGKCDDGNEMLGPLGYKAVPASVCEKRTVNGQTKCISKTISRRNLTKHSRFFGSDEWNKWAERFHRTETKHLKDSSPVYRYLSAQGDGIDGADAMTAAAPRLPPVTVSTDGGKLGITALAAGGQQ